MVSLVIGLVFFSQGTGVFAPRATPETTPKEVQISNVSDKGFTVSFITTEKTPGFIKYGEEPKKLSNQAGDERDQLKGTVSNYQVHYITVGGLKPNTTYYFTIGTASRASFDNNGQPFKVTTAKKASTPPAARTIYGSVVTKSGTPPQEAVVYVKVEGAGLLSSLVKKSGSWAVPLSRARTVDGSGYAKISDDDVLVLMALSPENPDLTTINTTVGEFESGATITLGESDTQAKTTPSPSASPTSKPTMVPSISLTPSATPSAKGSSDLGSLIDNTNDEASKSATPSAKKTLDLEADGEKVVQTTQPEIKGKARPKVKVKISIHSDNQIETEVVADENGQFTVDIAALSAELEPGEHTIEYTYIDPETGEEVTRVETFVVADPNQTTDQIAQANSLYPTNTPTPTQVATFGTDYPYSSETESSSSSVTTVPSPTKRVKQASPSSLPKAGVLNTTIITLIGGLFFVLVGSWSFWIALELDKASNS